MSSVAAIATGVLFRKVGKKLADNFENELRTPGVVVWAEPARVAFL